MDVGAFVVWSWEATRSMSSARRLCRCCWCVERKCPRRISASRRAYRSVSPNSWKARCLCQMYVEACSRHEIPRDNAKYYLMERISFLGGQSVSSLKFNRILVAIADPFAGLNKAVRRASALAHKTGASLELFHAIPSVVSSGIMRSDMEHFTRMAADDSRRRLERTANRLRREELVVNLTVQTGYPVHQAILRQMRLTRADLLVIEARKHNVF